MLFPLVSSKMVLVVTKLLKREDRGYVCIFELEDIFRHFPCISAGASLLLRGFFLISVLKFRSYF